MAIRFPRVRPSSLPAPEPSFEVEVVPMKRRDVRGVVAIEERVFSRPWSKALYLSELAQPGTRLYLVARVDGVVVGYAGCMFVAGEGHITTVGVAPEWQGKKVGMRLVHAIATAARGRAISALTLEVRVTNEPAQRLYRLFGFAPAGIRKNYYAEVNEDGLVMWAHDVDTAAYGERLERIGAIIDGAAGPSGPGPGPEAAGGTEAW